MGNRDWIFISTPAITVTQIVQVEDYSPGSGSNDKDSPRVTSGPRHSPHHARNSFLNSPTTDVARPDKISGADINSICQEVSNSLSLDWAEVGEDRL